MNRDVISTGTAPSRRHIVPTGAAVFVALFGAFIAAHRAGATTSGVSSEAEPARVAAARAARGDAVSQLFADAGVAYPPSVILLRGLKRERQLELWAGSDDGPMRLVHAYPVCAASGVPGPKRRQGDLQVPEGFYLVDRYNAWSRFHLSLGIDYPNAADRVRSAGARPGGDIFIHGACVSIGCLAITDAKIEEVFLAAWDTHRAGGAVHVHLFPTRMDEAGMAWLRLQAEGDGALLSFWDELRAGWAAFESTRRLATTRTRPCSR